MRPLSVRGGGQAVTREFVPQNSDIVRAERHRHHGQAQEAELICLGVLKTHPNSYEAKYVLGLIAHQAGQAGEAITHLRRAAALAPDLACVHAALGKCTGWLGASMKRLPQACARWRCVRHFRSR